MEQTDIGTVFDKHVAAEFVAADLDAAMATMAPDPYVYHVPTMAGGDGYENVRAFYGTNFIGKWPEDTEITQVSRTVGANQVVDELVLSFTHDIEMDTILPRIPPTGRKVTLPFCVVVGFEDGKVEHEHIYWDHASALVQIGVLDPEGLPVTGGEQAANLVERRAQPMNRLLPDR